MDDEVFEDLKETRLLLLLTLLSAPGELRPSAILAKAAASTCSSSRTVVTVAWGLTTSFKAAWGDKTFASACGVDVVFSLSSTSTKLDLARMHPGQHPERFLIPNTHQDVPED